MKSYSFDFNKLVSYLIMIFLSIVFIRAISNFVDKSIQGDTSAIEQSINSALMQCYALEGAYPQDKYHLTQYGVWFNDDKYYYDYDYFDGGIMPTVSVVSKSDRKALSIEGQEDQNIFLQ